MSAHKEYCLPVVYFPVLHFLFLSLSLNNNDAICFIDPDISAGVYNVLGQQNIAGV